MLVLALLAGVAGGFLGGYLCLWSFIHDLSKAASRAKEKRDEQ